jgi:hypothetical protein
MVNTLAKALGLNFKRIQFTPDLMPSDILGSEILDENRQFKFIKGPVFSNIILADEINRTPPKNTGRFAQRCKNGPLPLQKIISWTYLILFWQLKPYWRSTILCLRPSWIVLCLPSSSNTLLCRRSSGSETTTSDEINTINSLFAGNYRFSAIDS